MDIANPRHGYSQGLLSANPIPDPTVKRQHLLFHGETPIAREFTPGFSPQNRCPYVAEEYLAPLPYYDLGGHRVACHPAKLEAWAEPVADLIAGIYLPEA